MGTRGCIWRNGLLVASRQGQLDLDSLHFGGLGAIKKLLPSHICSQSGLFSRAVDAELFTSR